MIIISESLLIILSLAIPAAWLEIVLMSFIKWACDSARLSFHCFMLISVEQLMQFFLVHLILVHFDVVVAVVFKLVFQLLKRYPTWLWVSLVTFWRGRELRFKCELRRMVLFVADFIIGIAKWALIVVVFGFTEIESGIWNSNVPQIQWLLVLEKKLGRRHGLILLFV